MTFQEFLKEYQVLRSSSLALAAAVIAFVGTQRSTNKLVRTSISIKKQELDYNTSKEMSEITRNKTAIMIIALWEINKIQELCGSLAEEMKKVTSDQKIMGHHIYIIITRMQQVSFLEFDWKALAQLDIRIQTVILYVRKNMTLINMLADMLRNEDNLQITPEIALMIGNLIDIGNILKAAAGELEKAIEVNKDIHIQMPGSPTRTNISGPGRRPGTGSGPVPRRRVAAGRAAPGPRSAPAGRPSAGP